MKCKTKMNIFLVSLARSIFSFYSSDRYKCDCMLRSKAYTYPLPDNHPFDAKSKFWTCTSAHFFQHLLQASFWAGLLDLKYSTITFRVKREQDLDLVLEWTRIRFLKSWDGNYVFVILAIRLQNLIECKDPIFWPPSQVKSRSSMNSSKMITVKVGLFF